MLQIYLNSLTMNVNVDNLKDQFLDIIEDMYNKDYYFINSCNSKPNKYSPKQNLKMLSLQIYLEENNKITINCEDEIPYWSIKDNKCCFAITV